MSRLHECITKGCDNVKSTPHWIETYPTVGDRMSDLYLQAKTSDRAGTRNKTKRKTAHALGRALVLSGWKIRNSGIISVKSAKIKQLTKMKKVLAEKAKGDQKR